MMKWLFHAEMRTKKSIYQEGKFEMDYIIFVVYIDLAWLVFMTTLLWPHTVTDC